MKLSNALTVALIPAAAARTFTVRENHSDLCGPTTESLDLVYFSRFATSAHLRSGRHPYYSTSHFKC
jgi:hypothetical protein